MTFFTLKCIRTYSINVLFFFNSKKVDEVIEKEFNKNLLKISDNDRFRDAKINSFRLKRDEDLEAVGCTREQEKKTVKDYETRVTEAKQN